MIRVLRHLSRCIPARNGWSRLSVSYHFLLYIACLVKWCAILLYVHRLRHGEELLSLRAAAARTPAAALWYLVYFSNQHTKHRGMKMGVGSSRWDLRSFIQRCSSSSLAFLERLGGGGRSHSGLCFCEEHPGKTSRQLWIQTIRMLGRSCVHRWERPNLCKRKVRFWCDYASLCHVTCHHVNWQHPSKTRSCKSDECPWTLSTYSWASKRIVEVWGMLHVLRVVNLLKVSVSSGWKSWLVQALEQISIRASQSMHKTWIERWCALMYPRILAVSGTPAFGKFDLYCLRPISWHSW